MRIVKSTHTYTHTHTHTHIYIYTELKNIEFVNINTGVTYYYLCAVKI